jgi:hypothetical protein
VSRLAFLAPTGQVAGQFFGLTFSSVDIGTVRLMTDTHWLTIISQTSCDLFWRPANLQLSDDMRAQINQSDQLATAGTAI